MVDAQLNELLLSLPPVYRVAVGGVLGAIIGSFLATIVVRWPQGHSVVRGPSCCDHCGTPLQASQLLPLFSFVAARGRCWHCGTRIDRRHFALEAGAAVIGAVSFAAHPGLAAFATALLGWWLLLLAALDLEEQWLPDILTLPLLGAGLLIALIPVGPDLSARLIGAAAGFLSLFLIGYTYRLLREREGLGGGDPKIFAAIGAWLGWQHLPVVLLGAGLIGLLVLALLRAGGRRIGSADRLPLGTFLALAAWPVWLATQ